MMQLERREAHPDVRSLVLRGRTLERNLVLAPMAGVTSLPFRLIARQAGAALVYTETVSAKGLASRGRKSWALVESSPREQPLAYQLFGRDAEVLGEATRMLAERGAEFIDLNLGCPVKKFIRNGAGAALLRDPPQAGRLVRAMRQALPEGVLSVKMRLGWDATSITAPEVARIAEAEGCDFVSVHGRTRAQQYSGRVDRARIAEVVDAVRIPVLANGDVTDASDALGMLRATGAAGVMIGRGALANPWIFREIVERAEGRVVPPPTPAERARLVERHLAIMLDYLQDAPSTVHVLKKYLCAWVHGMAGAARFRERVNRARDLDGLLAEAGRFFQEAA
jgi:nifR3 family TIM-barrel protein